MQVVAFDAPHVRLPSGPEAIPGLDQVALGVGQTVLAIEHEGGGDVLAGRSAGAAGRLQLDGSVDDLPQWPGQGIYASRPV